ncbi:MAG: NADH-quinone oxidoreductase subunit H [Candidatus Verstraetearchaeota archaeon]|nr:NADH-quinone oxidoreductase subunit H [Candidatus Verstraetearchaeota archaeon]
MEALKMVDMLFTAVTMLIMIPVALFAGILYVFLFRKLSARFQWRVGPVVSMYKDLAPLLGASRILQPLYDILKLFGKDTPVPDISRKTIFIASPYLAFICAFLAIFFIPFPGVPLLSTMEESLVIASYLLIGAVMFTILGAASSGSPWGAIGARRDIEIFLIYELGFVVALFSVGLVAGSLSLWEIATRPGLPMLILNPFAAVLLFLVIIGKLAIKPLDMAEAEAEIVAGPFTEYGGKYLGLFQLAKAFLFYDMVALFIALFLAPTLNSILWLPVYIIAVVVILFFITVMQVLHPRFQIAKAMSWYGRWVLVFGVLTAMMVLVLRFYWVV